MACRDRQSPVSPSFSHRSIISSAAVSQETLTRKSQPGFMAATSELLDAWNISGYTLVVMDTLPSAMENTQWKTHSHLDMLFSIGFTGLNGISCIFCHTWGICDSQLHKTIAGGDIRHAWVMEKAPPSNPPEVVVLLRKSDRFQGQFRPTLVSNIFLHDHPDC